MALSSPEKPDEALYEQQEWLRVTLSSIGDAVITTDIDGTVTFLNPVAQSLTGWSQEDAVGTPLDSVFKIVHEKTRQTVENPATVALRERSVVRLSNHTLLIAKDGTEWPIDDSAAPIRNNASPFHDAQGEMAGVVVIFRDVTERRRQEHELRDALSYADNIIATLREPFLVLDNSFRVKTANRAFLRVFHGAVEQIQGRLIYELGDGQWDVPQLRTLHHEVLSDHDLIHDFNVEIDLPTIGKKILMFNARRIGQIESHQNLILLAIEDITERKRAEVLLQQSEARQRLVLDSIPQKIATTKPNGEVDYFNPQWTKFTGMSFEQIGEWGWKQVIHPADLVEHVRAWQHSINTGVKFNHESRLRRADGEYRWHISRASPMRDDTGKIVKWVGSNTDVNDIKEAELALKNSETRYRRLFETAKDGILILDTNTGEINDANPYMSDLLGYSHEHFLGKQLWEIGLFSDKSSNEAAVRTLQDSGYIRYEHLPLETSLGSRVEVEIVANAYQEGPRSVIQCNIRDITERSRLEKQLQEQSMALADLHRRKDEFLAMLSHELRNPLAPITNAVHLLRLQKNESPIQHQARTIIDRQVGQLTRLIDDLLEVSRITTGRIHLQNERMGLNGIVERAVETTRPLMDQRRHELTVSLSPQPIWLYADAARLEQVVVNLLTNAAKYTEEGGHIWLTVQQEANEAVLRVRDTGVGISPELLPRIFDLFSQADRSLARSQGGMGIGLSLVQRLVELHGGKVEAHSSLGLGSEFVVRLPLMAPPTELPPVPPDETLTPASVSLRVLVVDDNVDSAHTLGMLLRASGHEIRLAHDGLTAFDAALEFLPNVVLLDIGLPGIDGYEVAMRLRKQPSISGVVLVAMTGYGRQSDIQLAQEAGFNHHLVKPVDFDKVSNILASVSELAT